MAESAQKRVTKLHACRCQAYGGVKERRSYPAAAAGSSLLPMRNGFCPVSVGFCAESAIRKPQIVEEKKGSVEGRK
jgi:hypothetical protein